jgi:hypothetical protein
MMMASAARTQASATAAEELLPAATGALQQEHGEDPPLILALADLMRDQNGEVVLFNDSGLRALALSTDVPVVAEGEAGRHQTAAGEDVSGFRYVTFEGGLKLFYQPGLELILVREPPGLG